MTNEQKNILVAVLAVVLIGGGVFYYQKQQKLANLATGSPSQNSLEASLQNANQVLKPPKSQKNPLNISQKENTVKFNLAMDNARKAFITADYDKSVAFYNEALTYNNKTDTVYSGLFIAYSAQNNIDKARVALETAIKLNPLFTEYWIEKLTLLDEKTTLSFADLRRIYEEGLVKADPATKINLVTNFAKIAENNGEKSEAIALWEYAIEIYPQNKLIYQGEIDRLKSS